MELPKRKLTVYDILVMALLAAVLLFFLIRSALVSDASFFIVQTPDGVESYSLASSGTLSYTLNGMDVVIRYGEGRVCVISSGCPDQTCVNTRAISKPGESIICVPAQLVIMIPGDGGHDEDFIVG